MPSGKPLEGNGKVFYGELHVAKVHYYLVEIPTRLSAGNIDEPGASVPGFSDWSARLTVLAGQLSGSPLTLELNDKRRVSFFVEQRLSNDTYSVQLTGPILPGS